MNRTVTPCLFRKFSSACRTCLVKASEIETVSSSYRSGRTRFLTRVRGVWPSLYRILQTVSTRQTLMRLTWSVEFESCDHSWNVWSLDRCRSTGSPGLTMLTWPMPAGTANIKNPRISNRWRCLLIPSPTLRQMHVEPLRRCAKAPEDLRLNGQHIAVFTRIPCFAHPPLNRLHAPFDKCRILCFRDIGQTQHRRRFAQFFEQ